MDKDLGGKLLDRAIESNLQRMPTVTGAGDFARPVMQASSDSDEEGREGRDWLKERAFRYAERVLFAVSASQELQIRHDQEHESGSGAGGSTEDGLHQVQAQSGGLLRRMLLRWCRHLLEVRAVNQLSSQLSLSVRNAHRLDYPWQLEFFISTQMLPRTQVRLRWEPPVLRLRFDCPDRRAYGLLQKHVALLQSRLGSLTRYPLTIHIEPADGPGADQDRGPLE
jgi:Type III secretion protein (HpaP)